jgi:hypothetical protein
MQIKHDDMHHVQRDRNNGTCNGPVMGIYYLQYSIVIFSYFTVGRNCNT